MIEAKGHRYDQHGRRIEDSVLSVNVIDSGVHLHIDGAKRSQSWSIPREEWAKLVAAQPITFQPKRYAVCGAHAGDALETMAGLNVEIRKVTTESDSLRCWCLLAADYFLLER